VLFIGLVVVAVEAIILDLLLEMAELAVVELVLVTIIMVLEGVVH
jgi:hypothetical protein